MVRVTNVVSHKVFPQFDSLFDELDKIAWHQDEPFGSTSIYAQWNVFKKAKEKNITVMLDGQGADEQLAGYDGFFTANFTSLLRRGRLIELYKEMKAFKRIFGKSKFRPFFGMCYGILTCYFPNLTKIIARKILNGNRTNWLNTEEMDNITLKKIFKSSQLSILGNSLQQLAYTSVPALLHYEDRNSMAHSIESRVPFLDYRLVEFMISLPDSYKIHEAKTKYVLRKAMENILPDIIVNRHDKLGFVTPEEIWIRNNPDDFRRELIDACDRLPSLVDKDKVLTWFDERLNSNKSFGYSFWKLISVGRWMKVFEVEPI